MGEIKIYSKCILTSYEIEDFGPGADAIFKTTDFFPVSIFISVINVFCRFSVQDN